MRIRDVSDGTTNTLLLGESRYLQLAGGIPNWYSTWASGFYRGSDMSSGPQYTTVVAVVEAINSSNTNPATGDTHGVMNNRLGSHHVGGAHVLMVDGSTQFLSQNMDMSLMRSLARKRDGLPLGSF